MSSAAAAPGLGWGELTECHVWGTLWGGVVYPASEPPSSEPLQTGGLPGPPRQRCLFSLSLWGHWLRARPGWDSHNESLKVSAWPLPPHTSISWPGVTSLLGSPRPMGSPPLGRTRREGRSPPQPLIPTSPRLIMDSRKRDSALLEASTPILDGGHRPHASGWVQVTQGRPFRSETHNHYGARQRTGP